MYIDRQMVQEMNELSKEIFGTKSKWRKILESGEARLVTEEETVYNPEHKEDEPEMFTRRRIVMHHGPNGGQLPKHEIKHYSLEELRAAMITIKQERLLRVLESIKKEEEAKAKAAEDQLKAVISHNSGSAVV